MRSKKELGKILLENKLLFDTGLCNWIYGIYMYNFITPEEKGFLLKMITDNKPKFKTINFIINIDKLKYDSAYYYWEIGFIKPRIKWINKYLLNAEK